MSFGRLRPRSEVSLAILIFVSVVTIRVATIGAYPLMDMTEARYAEIAREMLEYGDWITPRIDGGEVFWAKPPLSMWATMLSFAWMGHSAFSARIASVLFSAVTTGCVFALALNVGGRALAWKSVCVLVSTSGFFVVSGAVMTDASLTAAVTLCLSGFIMAMTAEDRRSQAVWGYCFFAGLGLAMIAKGPVGVVLSAIPVGAWCVAGTGKRKSTLRLPWALGLTLTALISIPWYVAAERATPGFLHYFIVGEHFHRFLVPGWEGDRYGNAHRELPGTIWLFAVAMALPWALLLPWLAPRVWTGIRAGMSDDQGMLLFLVFWCLTPVLLFTPARNILPAYVAPGLPAFAIVCAMFVERLKGSAWRLARAAATRSGFAGLVMAFPILAAVVGVPAARYAGQESSQQRIAEFAARGTVDRLVYVRKLPYSAQFYTQGQAQRVPLEELHELSEWLRAPGRLGIAIERGWETDLPDDIREATTRCAEAGKFVLLVENDTANRMQVE